MVPVLPYECRRERVQAAIQLVEVYPECYFGGANADKVKVSGLIVHYFPQGIEDSESRTPDLQPGFPLRFNPDFDGVGISAAALQPASGMFQKSDRGPRSFRMIRLH